MKQGLIEARVARLANISQKIQSFINQKSSSTYTPFYRDDDMSFSKNLEHRAKRSLTDWRQLYQKNPNKIQPKITVYPSTADGFRTRCSMTGQCQRSRKAYTAAKASSTAGDRNFLTRQSRRAHLMESKRESAVQFALAQNCYEQEVLKDDNNMTAKARKFYQRMGGNSRQKDFVKVGLYLSNISEFRQDDLKQINATEKYVNNLRDFQYVKMAPYNLVKIKEKNKIDNNRYLQATANQKAQSSEKGLRYYERA